MLRFVHVLNVVDRFSEIFIIQKQCINKTAFDLCACLNVKMCFHVACII